ncbi:undecaprenyl-phosphate glucose phosphotransferase [Vibrio sp.]|nr:undecaprenyl-phosphate glucose phosphotransferase [Vibrio sp.]
MNSKRNNEMRLAQMDFSLIYRLADLTAIGLCFYLAKALVGSHLSLTPIDSILLLGIGLIFMLFAESTNLYKSWWVNQTTAQFSSVFTPWVLSIATAALASYVFGYANADSQWAILTWLFLVPFTFLTWRFMVYTVVLRLQEKGSYVRKAAIIGNDQEAIKLLDKINSNKYLGIKVIGFFDKKSEVSKEILNEFNQKGCHYRGSIERAYQMAKAGDISQVYVTSSVESDAELKLLMRKFADTTANVYLIQKPVLDYSLQNRMVNIDDVQMVSVQDTPFYGVSKFLKRAQDIVISSIILAMISPILVAIAVGIKATSKGPIVFKQYRYGLDGKSIKVWKFRSMKTMENGAKVTQATKNDPRVTKFGAFLRRTSLDELPQFINVLQGRMSIVGPRPHAVAHNEEYRVLIENYMLRHKVKPGITGWAQINGYRGETDTLYKMEKRVEFDLDYIKNWSLGLDIKIIFLTIFKGFVGKTAY